MCYNFHLMKDGRIIQKINLDSLGCGRLVQNIEDFPVGKVIKWQSAQLLSGV